MDIHPVVGIGAMTFGCVLFFNALDKANTPIAAHTIVAPALTSAQVPPPEVRTTIGKIPARITTPAKMPVPVQRRPMSQRPAMAQKLQPAKKVRPALKTKPVSKQVKKVQRVSKLRPATKMHRPKKLRRAGGATKSAPKLAREVAEYLRDGYRNMTWYKWIERVESDGRTIVVRTNLPYLARRDSMRKTWESEARGICSGVSDYAYYDFSKKHRKRNYSIKVLSASGGPYVHRANFVDDCGA